MTAFRYLDYAHRYHTLANTAVTVFSVFPRALTGWLVTIVTSAEFRPERWAEIRWWLAGLYVCLGLVASVGQSVSARRANAAFEIARAKLAAEDPETRPEVIARLTTPYQSRLIVSGIAVTTLAVGWAVVAGLGGATR